MQLNKASISSDKFDTKNAIVFNKQWHFFKIKSEHIISLYHKRSLL
jgi:hypothetical protein